MTGVRGARHGDLPRLLAIQEASLPEPSPVLLRFGVTGPPCVLVAGNPPVGYATTVVGDDVASLAEIAVAPNRRGRGYGSSLLDALVERLPDRVETVRLVVMIGNHRAREFYRDNGFRNSGVLPDHYRTGDGLLMARPVRS